MLDNMIFNANSITIPQGSVVKITDPNGVVLWQKENEPITTATPMYFENADLIPVTIGLARRSDSAPLVTMEISTDGNNWELWGDSASSVERVIPVGGKAYIRATTNVGYFNNDIYYTYNYFTSTGKVNVGGNIMSIGYKEFENQTIITQDFAYQFVFYFMDNLVDASNLILPADVVSPYCYNNMFYSCRQLKSSPKTLPATQLATFCYYSMFEECSSLTTAPELPATTLANNCYYQMFQGCTSLKIAPSLPATKLGSYCYQSMFSNCSSLTAAPALPATKLANSCYVSMFNGCRSLTTAPELPATTLAEYCYSGMFNCCTSLHTAPSLPATTLKDYCYSGMFAFCETLTTAPSLPVTQLAQSCYKRMFNVCTSLTEAPELPATTLVSSCYESMFEYCTNLNKVTTYAEDISASNCLTNWMANVSPVGDFYNEGGANYEIDSVSGIPTGWIEHTSL